MLSQEKSLQTCGTPALVMKAGGFLSQVRQGENGYLVDFDSDRCTQEMEVGACAPLVASTLAAFLNPTRLAVCCPAPTLPRMPAGYHEPRQPLGQQAQGPGGGETVTRRTDIWSGRAGTPSVSQVHTHPPLLPVGGGSHSTSEADATGGHRQDHRVCAHGAVLRVLSSGQPMRPFVCFLIFGMFFG